MTLSLKYKIYAALMAAAAVSAGLLIGSVVSNQKLAKLERTVEAAKQDAAIVEKSARELEQEAAEYKQKTEYLEESLYEIETIARKQDEKINELANETNTARDGVRRARAVRAIESTNAELCAKLAELGHPCGE